MHRFLLSMSSYHITPMKYSLLKATGKLAHSKRIKYIRLYYDKPRRQFAFSELDENCLETIKSPNDLSIRVREGHAYLPCFLPPECCTLNLAGLQTPHFGRRMLRR